MATEALKMVGAPTHMITNSNGLLPDIPLILFAFAGAFRVRLMWRLWEGRDFELAGLELFRRSHQGEELTEKCGVMVW